MEKFKIIEKIKDVKIKEDGTKSYRYYEIIECIDCGHQIKISSGDIRRKTSCKECNLKSYKTDFVGYENELYKVLEFTKQVGKRLFYKVSCKKCGNECEMRKDSIMNSQRSSCINCKGNGRIASLEAPINVYFSNYKRNANIGGLEWNLSNEDFNNIITKPCIYCGSLPKELQSLEKYHFVTERVKVNGVDRVNNELGYTLNNCVPCCTMCNKMKLIYSETEFLEHISQIFKYSAERSTTIL
jgi:hypothetical protein